MKKQKQKTKLQIITGLFKDGFIGIFWVQNSKRGNRNYRKDSWEVS